jgi:hypothetical protein
LAGPADPREIKYMGFNLMLVFCLNLLPGLLTESAVVKRGKRLAASAEKEMEMRVIPAEIVTHSSP